MLDKDIIPDDVPFQVQKIITDMLGREDSIHIRHNYRNRLDIIRTVIDRSIKKFDNDYMLATTSTGAKKR